MKWFHIRMLQLCMVLAQGALTVFCDPVEDLESRERIRVAREACESVWQGLFLNILLLEMGMLNDVLNTQMNFLL